MTNPFDENITRFVTLSEAGEDNDATQFISLGGASAAPAAQLAPFASAQTTSANFEPLVENSNQPASLNINRDDQTVITGVNDSSSSVFNSTYDLPPSQSDIAAVTEDGIFNTIVHAIGNRSFATRELAPGDTIDRYQVDNILAVGGTSRVYSISHKYLDKSFALKTLKQSSSEHTAELFLEEAKTLSKMNHPNVVGIVDAGVADSLPYMVLEHLHGQNLRHLLSSEFCATEMQALDLLEDICSVFLQQEREDIIHGDIKPDNIILRKKDGRFCLIDYGHFGRDNTSQGKEVLFMGTPKYMAPELKMGTISISADFFSLGLTLCEFLGGQRKTQDMTDRGYAVDNFVFTNEFTPALTKILRSLTAYDVTNRYQSTTDLYDDINRIREFDENVHGAMEGNAFVAIEFSQGFEKTFHQLENCFRANKLRCRRMDRLVFTQDIWKNIELEINHAKVVVADFTESPKYGAPNPNVLTEAAHARAVGKPLVIISQSPPEDLPFDWRHMPVLVYSNTPEGLQQLNDNMALKLKVLSRQ